MLIIAACSDKDENTKEDEEKETEVTEETEEVEEAIEEPQEEELDFEKYMVDTVDERLLLEPGEFSGENYDEMAVKKAIDQFPQGLEPEEYYYRLLALVAEDYRPYYEFFSQVDTSYESASSQPGDIDAPDGQAVTQVNVQVLFDASGSMGAYIGSQTKMDLAKNAVKSFVSDLPENVNVSLRVYGHKGTGSDEDKALSCGSTEEVFPLGTYDADEFTDALSTFSPAGWTPLAGAIEAAEEDLSGQTGENVENIIYVVSDGIETCDGNPVEAAKNLNESEIQAVVNIIGFDVDDEGQRQLKQVAEAGQGKYSTVRSQQEFEDYFKKAKRELIEEWFSWQHENVDKYFESQYTRVEELYDIEREMVDKAQEEEDILRDLSEYIEEKFDVNGYKIREKARKLGYELREYARDTAYQFREELRDKGYEHREEVRDKAYEEREKLRNQD